MKHTKGQWKQGEDTRSKEWMRIFSNKQIIAEIKSVSRKGERKAGDFEEEDANARLIAAAPELLEALELVYSLLNVGQPLGNDDLDKVHAAITKATQP